MLKTHSSKTSRFAAKLVKIVSTKAAAAFFLLSLAAVAAVAQEEEASSDKNASQTERSAQQKTDSESKEKSESKKEERISPDQKYRLLQSNSLLVESAYQQESGELQHGVSFSRSNRETWTTTFNEELPLGGEKHQLTLEIPAQFVRNEEGARGAGDAKIAYGYMLFGSNTSRVTVSPGFGLTLPTGNYRREMGRGAIGVSFKLPVSVMLGKRFASNSFFEATLTPRARNEAGERASVKDFEIGQSFVWFAKPKLNFLVEAVWEREQEVAGERMKTSARKFYVSPGARWAYQWKGVLFVPSVGVPFGFGAARGERGMFFSLAFEHSIKKEVD